MRNRLSPWIDRDDILRFLHVRGDVPAELEAGIDRGLDTVFSAAVFRHVQKATRLTWDGDTPVLDDVIRLPFDSLRHLFSDANTVYIVCSTIGPEVMRRIRQKLLTDAASGVVLDACASVVADAYAAFLQSELPISTGMRFSPGYGDVPLAMQREFFSYLDISRKIGVHLSAGDLMIPEKSVLFLAGEPPKEAVRDASCENCVQDCVYRKAESCNSENS